MVAVFWLVGLALAAQVPAAGSSSVAAPAAWLVHRFPARYRVSIAVAPARNTLDLSATSSYRQQVLIPVPVSDERQTVGPVTHSAGQLQVGSLDGQRVLYLESSRPIGPFSLEFEIQTSETVVDWSLVTTIRPYDRTSVDYRRYTGALAGWIEPDNARIRQISGSLRAQAADALDYARRAYAWLQANLEWRDVQGGGIDGIDGILARGYGDCGCLSSVYLSLLRAAGIPARFKVGGMVEADGGFANHMWTEFLLEGYGWIPADPSMFNGADNPCIGFEPATHLYFNRGDSFQNPFGHELPVLQTVGYWYRYEGGAPRGEFSLGKTLTLTRLAVAERAAVFNNPAALAAGRAVLAAASTAARAAAGQASLESSSLLDEAALAAVQAVAAGAEYAMLDSLRARGYAPNWYGWYYYHFTSQELTPYRAAAVLIAPRTVDARYRAAGYACFYDDPSATWYALVLLATPPPGR
ncbi:MAG: hypothetical protein A2087_13100 [Spirochaetes bacterium GWD1_61_31]|nr:MAG: hypothetical protein A2Y37_02505 [Spirochaetes bacterium GWB1_60_80]OHD28578.1 MAG: hypothetical protein A2004_03080 [Spirochaetes bacterium GWC1_61_12]OHD39434.1 MAG: hypothetical protein A2087_13100 [Spirochaetes bacterium GWD1_61_31]OHD45487.1 MAG: hypothetical protein A2Y35_02775 [Spirochaetes bacterium GWE1_60_18]OHD58061.1 MAG: hypothetical protein A2Y32_05350 [Spirochaetes bacterium GWF1_60_12]